MLKVSEDSYMIASTLDNKKLFLTTNDMETLRIKLFVFESQPCTKTEDWADAVLENTIVKWIPDKNYYTFVNRQNLQFTMALMRDTISKVIKFHSSLYSSL